MQNRRGAETGHRGALQWARATRLRRDMRRARRFARPLARPEPGLAPPAPIPPPLPPSRTVLVPGQGEVFVRMTEPVPETLPVLLLHGWTASADLNWFRCYDTIASGRQVIAVDHQGHGRGLRSDQPFSLERCADAAAGVLDELSIPRAIVVGYSMGGPIALHLAHRRPDRVAGLVLAATALEWHSNLIERWQWKLLRVSEVAFRINTGRGVVQRMLRQAVEEDPSLEPWQAWLSGESQRGYLPDIIGAGRALSRYDARPWVQDLDVPTAVVLTTADRLVKPRKQKQLARATASTIHTVDADHDAPLVGSSHFVFALVRAIDDVAAQLRRQPRSIRYGGHHST